ncbi:MAG: hypothetical protein AMS24_02570 [Chlamydiae bacterium SM23_39]|nr:MAG: hypothetical protein AMS24_02570 [Chlamydiae bacterium SM23_39]
MTNYILSKKDKLEKIREEIDEIDDKIILLLQKRFHLSSQTKKYKKKIKDKKREEEILKKISSPYIKKIYKKILKISQKNQ